MYIPIDVDKMAQASKLFHGEHDFKSFCHVGAQVDSTVRTIHTIEIREEDKDLIIRVCGNGFLYNMVRIIFGTLLKVAYGKMKPEEMKTIIEAKDRKMAGKTMPAKGLVLKNVVYDDQN